MMSRGHAGRLRQVALAGLGEGRLGGELLEGSGRYGDIRKALLSAPAIADDRSLRAPASPHDWLAEGRFALDEGLRRAGRRGAGRCGRRRQHRRQRAPR